MNLELLSTDQMNSFHSSLPYSHFDSNLFYNQPLSDSFTTEFYEPLNGNQNYNSNLTNEKGLCKSSIYTNSSTSSTSSLYQESFTNIAASKMQHQFESCSELSNELQTFYKNANVDSSFEMKLPKRRNTANRKERRRTYSINSAFSKLRERIPNVPKDTKLSKIKTLKLAALYIEFLSQLLDKSCNQDDEKQTLIMSCEDFKVDLQRFKSLNKSASKMVS